MAVRTGAGTGVVVSLVVFVLTTVFLLVLTIVFYAGKTKELEAKAAAENALSVYVSPSQRSSDAFRALEDQAKARRESVVGFLNRRYEEAMTFLSGNASTDLETVKMELARYGVGETQSVRNAVQTLAGDVRARQAEIDGLNAQLAELTKQLNAKQAELQQAKQAHQQEVEGFESIIASYRDAGTQNRQEVQAAIDEFNKAKDSMRSMYEGRIYELERQNDEMNRERGLLASKIAELEKARDATRIKANNPAMLVDGRIIDATGSSDEVFIDRGKKDRIVLGMTFEVYANESQIRVNPVTGELPRGKASLQVIKVSDSTSTCKITRSSPGQPIIRNDVIANAVYDPTYKFKFLVHGKFDIDGDGRPTENEAEYLRSLVIEWGGIVVTGDELPGDLDFLVLGVEPPLPPPPAADASPVVIDDWVRRRAAHDKYNQLFRQAREAQIPVLNANRFFILIGYTNR